MSDKEVLEESAMIGENKTSFDVPKLLQWFDAVAKSYASGVKLVRVTMNGNKVIRTVKIKDDVSRRSDSCQYLNALMCYDALIARSCSFLRFLYQMVDFGQVICLSSRE